MIYKRCNTVEQYEFVTKRESAPMLKIVREILQRARSYIRKYYSELDFEPKLIGSGKRHLITRVKNGNRGYDFDFNLVIDPPGDNQKWNGKTVHNAFLEAIRFAVKGTDFNDPEESTSVFTIKWIDKKQSKVNCSCDLAIVYYDGPQNQHYLHYHKENGGFGFMTHTFRYDVDEVVDELLGANPLTWNWIRDEYLNRKNKNKQNKRSFILFVEAVFCVYDQMFESDEEDYDYEED